MKPRTVPLSLALGALWVAPGCWTDNQPEYDGITAAQRGEDRPGGRPTNDSDDDDAVATDDDDTADDDAVAADDDAPADDDAVAADDDAPADDDAVAADDDAPADDDAVAADDDAPADDDDAPADDDASVDDEPMMTPMDGGGLGDTNEDEDPESDCVATDTVVDPDSEYYPPCCLGPALNGEEIKKGTQCTADDVQHCYRVCGPFQLGWKTEDCLAGVYAEGDCGFPQDDPNTRERLMLETGAEDYGCFAIPDEIDTSLCPQDAPPKSTDPCDIPECTPCNLRTLYRDTNDNTKEGYCVCRAPDANGERTWTCASITAWPCPFSNGC